MAGSSTISLTFKLEGDKLSFQGLAKDADGLKKAMSGAVVQAENLKTGLINFAALSKGINAVEQSVNQLVGMMQGWSDANRVQVEAETKLATVMRNTMGAREDEIESIKKFCAAQQEIGVVGDEVQLAGAQKLATFVQEKQSLEALIPVMNDLLVQQNGMTSTQENAAQVAALFGKAMNGQTTSLERAGFYFSDAQKQILKYGNEAQKVAVVAEVVESKVGGMNAEMAKTPEGKLQQTKMYLGDIKEALGALVQGAMPFMTIAAATTTAVGGLAKLIVVTKAAAAAIKGLHLWQAMLRISLGASAVFSNKAAQALRVYEKSAKGSAIATKALSVGLRGLLAATGIGLAITALVYVFDKLTDSTDEATEATNKFLTAEERAKREAEEMKQLQEQEASALNDTRAALELNIARLKNFKGTKEEEQKIVKEMNDTYGETMKYFSSVADWYKALIANSEAYCQQMILESKTRKYADIIAQKEIERDNKVRNADGSAKKFSAKRRERVVIDEEKSTFWRDVLRLEVTSDLIEAQKQYDQDTAEINGYRKRLAEDTKKRANIKMPVIGSPEPPGSGSSNSGSGSSKKDEPVYNWEANNIKGYKDNIAALNKELETCSEDRAYQIRAEIPYWQELIDNFGKADEAAQELVDIPLTIEEATNNLKLLNQQLAKAESAEAAAAINKKIKANEDFIDTRKNAGKPKEPKEPKEPKTSNEPVYDKAASTLKGYEDNIQALQKKLQTASMEEAANLNKEIKLWEKKADAIRNAGQQAKKTGAVAWNAFTSSWSAAKGLKGSIDSISGALKGEGDAWQTVTGLIDGFIGVADGIMAVIGIIKMLTAADKEQTIEKTVQTGTNIANTAAVGAETTATVANTTAKGVELGAVTGIIVANKLAAASYKELAAAEFMAAHAYIPFAGFGIAAGFIAGMEAIVATAGIPALAEGGIASGPTLALVGEYAGASGNPEVIAPLDKLRDIIQPQQAQLAPGKVEFKIKRGQLVGILNYANNYAART